MNKKFTCKFVSAIVAALIIMGTLGSSVSALTSSVPVAQNGKADFKYVALGASNVVGYGLHGYNFERVYEAPFEKEVENRYGYKMDTPGAYPVLIKEKLSENYNVELSLIGTSSMRAEEVRMLLDADYWGDSYTDIWFYDTNGDGKSKNWSSGAAFYEWQKRADADIPGYDHAPTVEEAFQTLRDATTAAVAEADLITIDAGMNNFGTYMLNLLSGKIFTSDIINIDPEIDKYYDVARNYVLGIVKTVAVNESLPEEIITRFADTLAYALVGYCYNMDATVERIYALNPDADVVVISIQNMMRDVDAVFPGYDGILPFGDIFGLVVNAANLYMSTFSPYADNYYYANVSTNGHTEFFLDEIATYNGDPSTLSGNLRDCFDVYDDNMFLKTRVQQKFAVLMSKSGFVNIHESQADDNDLESLKAFHYGFHYDLNKNDQPRITVSDGTPLKDFLAEGEAGKLSGNDKLAYEKYENMLSVAYDVVAEIMREAALTKTMNLSTVFSSSGLGVSAVNVTLDVLDSVLNDAFDNNGYSFDINTCYPNGFFDSMAEKYNVSKGVFDTLFCYSIRISLAGTAFCHPNENGYKEIFDIVWNAYINKIKGNEIINNATHFDYDLYSNDPYYLAIGQLAGIDESYAELFAEKIHAEGFSIFDNSGYRASELCAILDENYKSDAYGEAKIIALKAQIFEDFKASINDEKALERIEGFNKREREEFIDGLYEKFRKNLIEEIEKSDIISIDFDVADFTTFALNQIGAKFIEELSELEAIITIQSPELLSKFKKYEMDWSRFEEIEGKIDRDAVLSKLRDLFIANGFPEVYKGSYTFSVVTVDMEISPADIATYAAEVYLYSFVNYMYDYAATIETIRAINPDAEVVLIGAYSSLDGVMAKLGEVSMDLTVVGEVAAYAMNAQAVLHAMIMPNTTYVSIEDARNGADPLRFEDIVDLDLENLTFEFYTDGFALPETANEYVAQQLYSAINFNCEHEYDGCLDTECNVCFEARTDFGHKFGAWTVTKYATDTDVGEKQRICEVCREIETAEIEKLIEGKEDDSVATDEEPSAPSEDTEKQGDNENNSSGAVIAIVIGSFAVVGVGGVSVYWFAIKKKKIK